MNYIEKQNEISEQLNRLLLDNGFVESFVVEKFLYQDREFEKIVLHHKTDKQKTIGFVDTDDGGMLYYFNSHEHIDYYTDDIKGISEQIFERIKSILENKIIAFFETNRNGNPIMSGFSFLEFDTGNFSYSDKERNYLANHNITFDCWNGEVSYDVKLYVIGEHYTKMPEIQTRWESLQNQEVLEWKKENMLWEGKPSKAASILFPIKICGWMFIIFTAICSLGLLNNWRTFLFFEVFVVLTMLIVFPVACKQMKHNFSYTITKDFIIIAYAGMVVRYRFEDILKIKIKYAFYENDKKYGTIKVKVRGKWLTSLNNHLYSILEPEKVLEIIEECRKENSK